MSLPIVTTSVGGISYVLKNKFNAILTPPNDHEIIAEGCLKIIKNKELRKKIIKNGRETVIKIIEESDPKQISSLVKKIL